MLVWKHVVEGNGKLQLQLSMYCTQIDFFVSFFFFFFFFFFLMYRTLALCIYGRNPSFQCHGIMSQYGLVD